MPHDIYVTYPDYSNLNSEMVEYSPDNDMYNVRMYVFSYYNAYGMAPSVSQVYDAINVDLTYKQVKDEIAHEMRFHK